LFGSLNSSATKKGNTKIVGLQRLPSDGGTHTNQPTTADDAAQERTDIGDSI
jgi:hypothetical protein